MHHKVLDRHVLSLIISADKNLGRQNFKLLWNDFNDAKKLNRKTFDLLLSQKELLYKICENYNQCAKILKFQLKDFSIYKRLQILSMIILNKSANSKSFSSKVSKSIDREFKKSLDSIDTLSSSQIKSLLLPISPDLRHIFNMSSLVKLFWSKSNTILSYLTHEDLLDLIDCQNIFTGVYDIYAAELDNRINYDSKIDISLLMEFYLGLLECLSDNVWWDYNFIDIIEDADSATTQKMKTAALKFSKHAHGHAKIALETFDFTILDTPFSSFIEDFDDDSFDDAPFNFNPFDDDDPFDDDPKASRFPINMDGAFDMLNEHLISVFEDIIDCEGLRGASMATLVKARNKITKEKMFDTIPKIMKKSVMNNLKKKLSKEAIIVFCHE